ncbi:MAG TPA: gephyrin-like molybdotransferase Glp [Nocardioidaceae bacterium]|nr:gephyrin-like molybdotransferase Glp [Nocardioidaceae bacterium]
MVTETAALRNVDDHLSRILAVVAPLPAYDQPLLEALGLPLGEDVRAAVDLPNFDNSAMDGYAVRAVDVAAATGEKPVRLPVVGEVAAGQNRAYALSPGATLRIMTGAAMPHGADAVVPLEWTDQGVAVVDISQPAASGTYVRRQGEDVRKGDLVVEEGTIVGPREVGLLAAVGRAQVRTRPRPRVVVVSTGNELREPGTSLALDSIYDSNSYLVAAAARAAGAIAYRVGIVPDSPREFADALSDQLVRADLVVTTGGVSKGAYDIVKDVLSRVGTVDFYDVAMQPGKPQGFGTVGEDATPILTLPGNPVSTYVSFEVFCVPAIRRMTGRMPYQRPLVQATCTEAISSVPGRRQFVRGRFRVDTGGARVTPFGGHGSHLVGGLAASNCLVVVPEDTTAIDAGETVEVMALDRDY